MAAFLPQGLIRNKRDGGELSADEIRYFIDGVTSGDVPDYQVSAMLMAIFFRGLSEAELAAWADAMLHSGDVLDLSAIPAAKIDKHSTGGVGDKISLPLAAAVGACGVAVPMVSGRGLGHTGGTLDKLESIPGFNVNLSVDQFRAQVKDIGVCLIGQTERIAPADKILYALRDVTATVESIPLIASSIMSKKLAEGIDGLVLDCKVGSGAFMKTIEDARALAQAIIVIGRAAGKQISVLVTDMDKPIGRAIGNALEVAESIEVMRGGGPADTRELTVHLGGEMLSLAGAAKDAAAGRARIESALDDGSALEKFGEIVRAQGGDAAVTTAPDQVLPRAGGRIPVAARQSGVVTAIEAREVGVAALVMGAGRRKVDDEIDPAVGVEMAVTVGQAIEAGAPLCYLHHNGRGVEDATRRIEAAFTIGDDEPRPARSRILEAIR